MFVSKKKILGTEIKYKIYTSSVPTYGLFYLSRYRDFTIYLNRMYIKCLVRLLPTVCYWLQGSLCLISQPTRTVSFSPLIYNPLVSLTQSFLILVLNPVVSFTTASSLSLAISSSQHSTSLQPTVILAPWLSPSCHCHPGCWASILIIYCLGLF